MRPTIAAAVLLILPCLCLAQARPAAPEAPGGDKEPRIERLRQQDKGARIDELRVRGETQQITVTPAGDLPAYEVSPESGNTAPGNKARDGAAGRSGWKLFNF